jgi:hypothetical protein
MVATVSPLVTCSESAPTQPGGGAAIELQLVITSPSLPATAPVGTTVPPVSVQVLNKKNGQILYNEPVSFVVTPGGGTVYVPTGVNGTPTWTQLNPAGIAPPGRAGHSAVYDASANTMTVFGGSEAGGNGNDVWVLSHANGMGGVPTWTQLARSGGPAPGRAYHAAIYDPSSGRMTVYAGINASNSALLGDVWVFTEANGR